MSEADLSLQSRNALVRAYWESHRQTSWPIADSLTSAQRSREYAKQRRLLERYGKALPAVPVSRCPVCADVLSYVFDPMGLDGPWWHLRKLAEFPLPGERHYRLLQGAIDFHGREPLEASVHRTVRPGPGAPFVIPRLFSLPEMRAVISTVSLPHGDTGYLTAYFSPSPVHGALLGQTWARIDYEVLDERGEGQGWGIVNDIWDFNLKPWVESGHVMWINPGDSTLTIQKEGPCPYIDLPGIRAPQSIDGGKLSTLDLPTGAQPRPFD